MPFETSKHAMPSVAVIGAGISGMGAAEALAQSHRVVLFEAEAKIGGHARTRLAGPEREDRVDTGFIVFNYANYPNMAALFDRLDVPVVKSDMSFGASINGGRFEYALRTIDSVFAQRKNAFNPRYIRMLADIFRFNRDALEASKEDGLTIGGLIEKMKLSDWFRDYYLLPLSGAIWSTPIEKILDFPAYAMMQFFENHALLHHTGQHQWYTVEGGSASYVTLLEQSMRKRGVDIRTSSPIDAVRRVAGGVEVKAVGGDWEYFDEVIFATHSDDSLRLLADPTEAEKAALGNMKYQPNHVVLHSDESILPKRKKVWSSWVYTQGYGDTSEKIDLTYWMNSLQPWLRGRNYFVTLNSTQAINPDLIWDEVVLRHPVYDLAALQAQKDVQTINGDNATWFCGAWMQNGFHEDGLTSGLNVVEALVAKQTAEVAAQ